MVDAGGVMFAYTPMFMHMDGNYIGSTKVSAQTIASTVPSGSMMNTMMGSMPQMYRVVPGAMDMQAHMVHAMVGVTDWLNVTAMLAYARKNMDMTTFPGCPVPASWEPAVHRPADSAMRRSARFGACTKPDPARALQSWLEPAHG